MTKKLTSKQEGFCYSYIETGNASEAYRRNYNAGNMSTETIKVKASQMLRKDNIRITLKELRAEHKERHLVDADRLTAELYEARADAQKDRQHASVIKALMGIARIHGLDVQKSEVDIKGKMDIVARLQKGREYARRD